jgi:glycosyltransferase involved in cell wall biosynthesis
MLRARLPWKRSAIHWVPVGSNIPVAPGDGRSLRTSAGIPEDAPLLGVFSLFGAAKGYSLLEAAWRTASLRADQPFIVLIGASAEEAARHLPEMAAHPRCRATGYLSQDDVSRWLSEVDLLLAPFEDGVSSRRTSVIAALAHSVPVVTTRGRNTDPLFLDSPLRVTSGDASVFAREMLALLDSADDRAALGAASRVFCDRHFSWPAIARQLLPARLCAAAIEATP